ncbi:ComEC/Rec2 family competence protein [Psychrobacter pygoscelis]|uniref:ComEC/Rec2 family competence protein n=1 Tax=Psychrobacter pygoscelis TaxID=2488563 RepID=UPI00103EDA81|nr:ComEC/Rec2 family competence protein [Psychrobacter pygoscelis]
MFWWLGGLIVVVMVSVLHAMTGQLEFGVGQSVLIRATAAQFARPVLFLLATVTTLLALRYRQWLLFKCPMTPQASSTVGLLSQYTFQGMRFLHSAVVAVIFIIVLFLSALLAISAQYNAHLRSLPQPIRVQALVTIEGLSDSLYAPQSAQGYRQRATLTNVVFLGQDGPQSYLNYRQIDKNKLSNKAKISPPTDVSNPWFPADSLPTDDNNQTIRPFKVDGWSSLLTSPNALGGSLTESSQPLSVLLSAYPKSGKSHESFELLNSLAPQQQVVMILALNPIDSEEDSEQAAVTGFNSAHWLRARHIDATARLLAIDSSSIDSSSPVSTQTASAQTLSGASGSGDKALLDFENTSQQPSWSVGLQRLRWDLRQHFMQDWSALTPSEQQARAVTLSLLTGDRALITRATKDSYQLAGISHLLAISGSHVLFLAIILANLIVAIVDRVGARLYMWLPKWQVRWLVMVVTAFIYAAFTGFDVPAARTAWMLVATGVVRTTLLPISSLKVLLGLAIMMAWYDPFVLWQAGYWLSFIAVALLLVYEQLWRVHDSSAVTSLTTEQVLSLPFKAKGSKVRGYEDNAALITQCWRWLTSQSWQLIRLQLWLFMALLPVTLLLFGKVSLWGLIINLFAIGLYGMVIVPLNLLAGICYLLNPALADIIWSLTISIVAITHTQIDTIVQLPLFGNQQRAWLYTPVNLGTLIIIALIFLPWLFAQGVLSRWIALAPTTLLLLSMTDSSPNSATSSPEIYLLPTSEAYLSAVLLKDAEQQAHWLMLADYRTPREAAFMPLNAQKLSEKLQQHLGMLGIYRLQGIIVQTPNQTAVNNPKISPDNRHDNQSIASSLAMVARLLSAQLPTGQWWQAGNSQHMVHAPQFDLEETQLATAPRLSATPCQVGKQWQAKDRALGIYALTGWPNLNPQTLGGCVIIIESRYPINIYKFSVDKAMAPEWVAVTSSAHQKVDQTDDLTDRLNTQQSINIRAYNKKSINNDPNNKTSNAAHDRLGKVVASDDSSDKPVDQHMLIIDAATHQQLWSLWQMLCNKPLEPMSADAQSPRGGPSSLHNQLLHQLPKQQIGQQAVLITHRQSRLDEELRRTLPLTVMLDTQGQHLEPLELEPNFR